MAFVFVVGDGVNIMYDGDDLDQRSLLFCFINVGDGGDGIVVGESDVGGWQGCRWW